MNSSQAAWSGLPCMRMSRRISSGREPPRNTRSRGSALTPGWVCLAGCPAACIDQEMNSTSSARQAKRIFIGRISTKETRLRVSTSEREPASGSLALLVVQQELAAVEQCPEDVGQGPVPPRHLGPRVLDVAHEARQLLRPRSAR